MKKKLLAGMLTIAMLSTALAGCGGQTEESTDAQTSENAQTAEDTQTSESEQTAEGTQTEAEEVTITVFAAKSLNTVLDELIADYEELHENVTILASYDSSGTLMTQIEEGAACDVFFSAAQTQMNELSDKNLLTEGTRHNVVNNQVCVVTYEGSDTEVTGLADLSKAKNMALADGSVPVGKYTRLALVNAGILPETDDVAAITTQEVSEALGGLEINECANVGAVTAAVAEASNEVGTIYYSDLYGLEDQLKILEVVPYSLTGNVIYPVSGVLNDEATDAEVTAANDFINYLISDDAKSVFFFFFFDINVED